MDMVDLESTLNQSKITKIDIAETKFVVIISAY